jgi:hypothetical protein
VNGLRGVLTLLAVFVSGAAAAQQTPEIRLVPGTSAAGFHEQTAIAIRLMDHFRLEHDCLTAQTLFAQAIGDGPSGTKLERWTVTHCGAVSTHVVALRLGDAPAGDAISIDESKSEVVLPKASVSCAIDERKQHAKDIEKRAKTAASAEEQAALRAWALALRVACYPRPLAELGEARAAVITVEFARDGTLLEHRLQRSSGDALMDAEANFMWTRVGALKRRLKLPAPFRPGSERVVLEIPVGFRGH